MKTSDCSTVARKSVCGVLDKADQNDIDRPLKIIHRSMTVRSKRTFHSYQIYIQDCSTVQKQLIEECSGLELDDECYVSIPNLRHGSSSSSCNYQDDGDDSDGGQLGLNTEMEDGIYFRSCESGRQNDNENTNDLRKDIKQWALNHHISHVALSDLLKILNSRHDELPKDGRTLTNCEGLSSCEIA